MFHLIATEFRRNGAVRQEALDFLDETLDLDGWNGAEHRAIIAPRLAFLLHVAREWVESRESKLFEDEGPDNLGQKTAELALKWGRPNRWLLERHRRAVLRAVRAGSENALDHALVALLWEVPGYSIEETLRALVPMARRLCRTRANVWPDFSCVMRSQSTSIEGLLFWEKTLEDRSLPREAFPGFGWWAEVESLDRERWERMTLATCERAEGSLDWCVQVAERCIREPTTATGLGVLAKLLRGRHEPWDRSRVAEVALGALKASSSDSTLSEARQRLRAALTDLGYFEADDLYTAKPGTPKVSTEAGEARQRRFDPDADWHTEGGGERVWGIKFAHISTRRAEGRFILGVEHVEKDEAKAALEMLRRLKPHAPGAQAVVWDMILRGDHLQAILAELGLIPVVKVHAKENPDGGKGRRAGTYVPKTLDLDSITVTVPGGTERVVQIAAYDGWASVKELTETGEPYYERLERGRLQRHEDTAGYRWYGYYKLPAAYGRKVVPVRHHQNADDDRRGLNRTENLRPIPEGSEDFAKLHVLRPDAESINRGLEDSLFINRASAKGWRRQTVDLLGHARLVNATTLARCRARAQLAAVA